MRFATLAATVDSAVRRGDAKMAGLVAEDLRFTHGFRYAEVAAFAKAHAGVEAAEWEQLMMEVDDG